jgi:uncharacterized protein (TIGR03437 family)
MKVVFASAFLYFSVVSASVGQITLNPLPTRVIGQDSLTISNLNPNLVEGREFFSPQGIALDFSTNPPALYVSDTANNRVLGFRIATSFANGQKADIVIGQVDLLTTFAEGPGRTTSTTGLASPTGITVDSAGNLYVVDSGNNRVLRFPKPFAQTGDELPDLVIGQPGFSTNTANQGGISAATLSFSATSTFVSFIALDSTGNLWVADPGNNRVLRFNAKVLGAQPMPGPSADLVLGQADFVTGTYAAPASPLTSVSAFTAPTGIAFDQGGRLFVSESVATQRSRILVWNPPFASGQFASRVIGVDLDNPQPPTISPLQLGPSTGALFTVGNQIGIADSYFSRLLLYPSADQWTSNTLDQTASQVVGQPDFNSGNPNQSQPGPSAVTLSVPSSAAFSGTELYIADSSNNRVVVLPYTGSAFGPATRVLGQDGLTFNAPNLIEGREFDFLGSTGGYDAGIAVDLNSSPPHLYVADTYNNRILGYNDLRNIQPGAKADLVIGQPDFQHQWANYPTNNSSTPNQSGLSVPTGLAVDSSGNLYVADTGNGRVLRFPAPFSHYTPGTPEAADLVLGQPSFFYTITTPTNRTMAAPYGLALTNFPGLLVSDVVHSRVLFFTGPNFTNGQAATNVFGQPDFNSAGAGSGLNQLSAPHHIANDSDDRLYVADTGNGRVLIFDHAPNAAPYPQAAYALTSGLASPRGMYVSPVNGDIWVADASAAASSTSGATGAAVRYPAYNALEVNGYKPNATLQEASPRALTEDAWGNVFIADSVNRVVIHYPGLSSLNAANFLFPNLLAPGMIAALYSTGNFNQFGTGSQAAGTLPLPTTLNGLQVLFNNVAVPLFYAGPNQINFQVPNLAPQSGTADIQVLEAATGRLLGDSTVEMNAADPGLFTQAGNGSGAASAVNADGTLNTQTNPALSGSYITLYGTGVGYIPGAPPDGQAPSGAVAAPRAPTLFIFPDDITGSAIQYSGLAPTLVGVWQINVQIPSDIPTTMPTQPTYVIAIQASIPSGGPTIGRTVQIYVKHP